MLLLRAGYSGDKAHLIRALLVASLAVWLAGPVDNIHMRGMVLSGLPQHVDPAMGCMESAPAAPADSPASMLLTGFHEAAPVQGQDTTRPRRWAELS